MIHRASGVVFSSKIIKIDIHRNQCSRTCICKRSCMHINLFYCRRSRDLLLSHFTVSELLPVLNLIQFFSDREAVKGRKVVLRRLPSPDQLHASIFLQKQLR